MSYVAPAAANPPARHDATGAPAPGTWQLLQTRPIWNQGTLDVDLLEARTNSGRGVRYEVVRARADGVGCLAEAHSGQVLLVLRNRLATQRWGWELPGGTVHEDQDPVTAAVARTYHATGFEVYDARLVFSADRWPERSDAVAHLVWARVSRRVTTPNPDEVSDIGWFDAAGLMRLLEAGQVSDAFTSAALWRWLVDR